MSYWLNEVPSGLIDGSNKVYTTAQNISTLVDIVVDGMEYTDGILIAGNQITLDWAPTATIVVSYWDSPPVLPITGITLQVVKDRLSRRLKDISDVPNELWYDMATDLNQLLYREMFSVDPSRFITNYYYTVATSPSTQALPATFRDIQEGKCGFYVKDSAGNVTTERLTPTSIGSTDRGYYLDGTNVVFTGINASTNIVLRFIPVLGDITSFSDTFCVPSENKDLVTEGMMVAYWKNDEDGKEVDSDQRFARLLGEFLKKLRKGPNVLTLNTTLNSGS